MIQPLRVAHRRAFGVLAMALPIILFAGIEERHPLQNADLKTTTTHGDLVKAADGLWRQHSIRTEFYRNKQHSYVELWPKQNLGEPDLLLYWTVSAPQDVLPSNSRLLGTFAVGKAIPLPDDVGSGYLALYSLGHQSVVDTAAMEKLP